MYFYIFIYIYIFIKYILEIYYRINILVINNNKINKILIYKIFKNIYNKYYKYIKNIYNKYINNVFILIYLLIFNNIDDIYCFFP